MIGIPLWLFWLMVLMSVGGLAAGYVLLRHMLYVLWLGRTMTEIHERTKR